MALFSFQKYQDVGRHRLKIDIDTKATCRHCCFEGKDCMSKHLWVDPEYMPNVFKTSNANLPQENYVHIPTLISSRYYIDFPLNNNDDMLPWKLYNIFIRCWKMCRGALSFIFVSCVCHGVAAGAHDVVALRRTHVASHLAAFLFCCFHLLRRFGLVSRFDRSW